MPQFWTGRFQVLVTGRRDTQVLCAGCGRWLPIIGAIGDRDKPFTYYHAGCVPQEA